MQVEAKKLVCDCEIRNHGDQKLEVRLVGPISRPVSVMCATPEAAVELKAAIEAAFFFGCERALKEMEYSISEVRNRAY